MRNQHWLGTLQVSVCGHGSIAGLLSPGQHDLRKIGEECAQLIDALPYVET